MSQGVTPSRTGVVVVARRAASDDGDDSWVRELLARAEAGGGDLVAFGADELAVAFADDEAGLAAALALADAAGELARAAGQDDAGQGLSRDALREVSAPARGVRLALGPALATASRLSRAARRGETLVDARVPGVATGALGAGGDRTVADGRGEMRAVSRRARELGRRASLARLASCDGVGLAQREGVVARLVAVEGAVAVLRAGAGEGASAVLAAVERAGRPGEMLVVAPAGVEPLGALRCAVEAFGEPERALEPELAAARERLLAGRGADLDALGRLVVALLGGADARAPVVAVEADLAVDEWSHEAVARALGYAPLRVVVRAPHGAPLPPAYEPFAAGAEVVLEGLDEAARLALVRRALGAAQADFACDALAREPRAPLALVEAAAAVLRGGDPARAATLGAGELVAERFATLAARERVVLGALAALHGRARLDRLELVARDLGVARADLAPTLDALVHEAWLASRPGPHVSLPTATHARAVLASLGADERVELHRAVATAIEATGGPLARAEAARQAQLAGDHARSARLALAAAEAVREIDATLEASITPPNELPQLEPTLQVPTVAPKPPPSAGRGAAALAPREAPIDAADARHSLVGADGDERRSRGRTSLARASALAASGRRREALRAALEALSSARAASDEGAARACAGLLASLASAEGDRASAEAWRAAART